MHPPDSADGKTASAQFPGGSPDGSSAPTAHLARSAGVIGLATMASRVLGLVREQVMAYLFGAGHAMDAFNVAFRVPNLLRDLFAEGAMSAAFVPAFTRRLTQDGRGEAWRLSVNLVNTLVLLTGTLVLLGMLFAEPLTWLLARDYNQVPGKFELTVLLTRIMLPFLTLVALAAALMGMLNSLGRFFVPAFSPAMSNVGIIACALALVPLMPRLGLDPIVGIAVGVIIGGLGQIAIQVPPLLHEGFRWRPRVDLRDAGLLEILRLMGPGTVAGAAVQINVFVNTILATGEGEGAVSWLGYAFRLMYLPIGLFGVSIATAALPALSRHAASEDLGELRRTLSGALRLMLMLNVPATLGLMVLARPIVDVIFQHGSFGPDDTAATAAALVFYAPGLIGYSAVRISVPCFYALGNSRTPTAVSILAIVVNVILNVTLVRVLGYRGLALGTSIAALFNAGTLMVLLRGRLQGLDEGRVATSLVKILVASLAMAAGAFGAYELLLQQWPDADLLRRVVRLMASIGIALGVLIAAARLLKIEELSDAQRRVLTRLTRR